MKNILYFIPFIFLACEKQSHKKDNEFTNKITSEKICLEKSLSIGKVNDIEFSEGGFSGLTYVPNSENEFLAISDRGPNLKYKVDSISSEIKIFPFPNYHPKILKLKIEENQLVITDTLSIKNFDEKAVVGLPVANLTNQTKEIAWENTQAKVLKNHPNGIDAEAINIDKNGDYWISDEYQTSLWKINSKSGIVQQKFTPQQSLIDNENTYLLPEVFQFRKPNRGFESVSVTPNGNVWSILQSPAWYPSKEAVKEGRLIRMLQLNPETKETSTYMYEHDQEEGIRQKDWKIGDMTAISDSTFLTIEHATRKEKRFLRIYKVDVSKASPIAVDTKIDDKTPEELKTADNAKKSNIIVVKKTLIMDLADHGFDEVHGKPEGITMLNDTTLVIVNDNDYAIEFDANQQNFINNGVNTCLYLYTLPKPIDAY